MLYLERYSPQEHLSHINSWTKARGIAPVFENSHPKLGYVAYERGTPLAAAFLLRCDEGEFAIFDGLITDPSAEPCQRDHALDLLTIKIKELAKEMKFRAIIAWIGDKHTLERSLRHGYIQPDQTLICLDLSK